MAYQDSAFQDSAYRDESLVSEVNGFPLAWKLSGQKYGKFRIDDGFDLSIISVNTWALEPNSNFKDLRMEATIKYLENSNHDIVFLQEVWMYSDFKKLKRIFPYSSHFGTPDGKFCPQVR